MAADVKAAEFAAKLRDHPFVKNATTAASLLKRAPGTVTVDELRGLLNWTAANSAVLDMTGMTVTITDQVTLQDHPGIKGGTFIINSSSQRAGLLIRTTDNRTEARKTFILGSTFLVHAQHSSQAAVIYAVDGRHVVIDECKILGVKVGRAIYVRGTTSNPAAFTPKTIDPQILNTAEVAFDALVGDQPLPASGCCNVHVLRTQIYMNTQDGEAITFESTRVFAPQSSAREAWRVRNATATVTAPVSHCIVAECDITGGHYGVAAYGARLIWVGGCRLYRQVRGTSAQDTTQSFLTHGCDIFDPKSTAHHNAYGADQCRYAGTVVDTGRSNGEGLLQAYVGCGVVHFVHCNVLSHSETKALYMVYAGVGADVTVRDSYFMERQPHSITRGICVVETDWIDSTKAEQSRAFGGTNGELDKFLNKAIPTKLRVVDSQVLPLQPGMFAVIRPTSSKYGVARCELEYPRDYRSRLRVYSEAKTDIRVGVNFKLSGKLSYTNYSGYPLLPV